MGAFSDALLAANLIASVREAVRPIRAGELADDEASRVSAFPMFRDTLKA